MAELALETANQVPTSRYTFCEVSRHTLRITGSARTPVMIMHDGPRFAVTAEGFRTRQFGLFDYFRISRAVAEGLMLNWESPKKGSAPADPMVFRFESNHGPVEFVPKAVHEWAVGRVAKCLGKRLHSWYKARLAETDPLCLDIQRIAFAAMFTTPQELLCERFYAQASEHILRDLKNYRAAAIALGHLPLFEPLRQRTARQQLERSVQYEDLRRAAAAVGLELELREMYPAALERRAPDTLDLMESWRGLFSPTGEPYRSLNRTLMNLPGGIAPGVLPYLKMTELERPILERSSLTVACLYGMHSASDTGRNKSVFMNASPDRIRRAMRLVAEHTRNQLSFRRTVDLKFLVGFLLDYPEEHRGNIVGLAEKAIRWHLDQAQAEADRVVAQLGGQREAAKPPIALPDDPRITLLSTVDEIVAEGRAMGNCVSSYAGSAVRGECYLLHAAKDGEDATIEVTWRGEVSQAVGPRNRLNDTARWGRRVLSRWGKTFPKDFVPPELPSGAVLPEAFDDMPF
jgi:hypothetical protein